MRRILLVFTAMAVMVAMMSLAAVPAFAVGGGGDARHCETQGDLLVCHGGTGAGYGGGEGGGQSGNSTLNTTTGDQTTQGGLGGSGGPGSSHGGTGGRCTGSSSSGLDCVGKGFTGGP